MALTTMPQVVAERHPNRLPDGPTDMAKVDLKKVQRQIAWLADGAAVAVAIALARLTRKEAAARLGMGESQLAAQIAGLERPQIERLERDAILAGPMLVAMALQRPDVFEVVWTITAKVVAS